VVIPEFFMHLLILGFVVLALACAIAHAVAPQSQRTVRSAITPFNRNPGRHAGFMQRIEQGPVGLLFLGDSIMDAWPLSATDTWESFLPFQVADFGISGERTEDVLWRITNGELDGIAPKAVVIMIGTNNIGHFEDERPAWAAAGVRLIVDTVRATLPQAKILLLAVFPRGASANDSMRMRTVAINDIIRTYADGSHVTYLDLSSKFLDEHGNLPTHTFPDQLHPNAHGYRVWHAAMWPVLRPMLQS
jgi:lysophospholipase L1-like esterase